MWRIGLAKLTVSGVSPAEVVSAAHAARFGTVGLRLEERLPGEAFPHAVTRDEAKLRHLRGQLVACGVRVSNVTGHYLSPQTRREDLLRLADAAATLGSALVTAVGHDPDTARLAANLAQLGEIAQARGMKVALEFISYSAVSSLAAAVALLDAVGRADVGLMVDPLHLSRSGGAPADLAAVRERIFVAQLCDAKDPPPQDVEARTAESRTSRLYPGQGDLPLFDLLDRLPADCEVEIESPQPDHVALPAPERARLAAAAFAAFLARYAQRRAIATDAAWDAVLSS